MSFNNVYGYVKDSFSDWPGKIAPVIFVRGCNCRCPTCHNFELAYKFDKKQIPVNFDFICEDIESKKNWYEGIVLSGGEVSIVKDLEVWLKEIKKLFNLPVKVDTNGLRPDIIIPLIEEGLIDFCSIDVKGPYELYPKLIGKDIDVGEVKKKLREYFVQDIYFQRRVSYRITEVPVLSKEDIEEVRGYLPYMCKLIIQKYRER